jgi:hypothetical protein
MQSIFFNAFQCKFYFKTEISKNVAYLKTRYYDILLEQTKISPNCTSVIQPLDLSIARRFDMVRYMNLKKSIKLDKLKTLGSIRGVQFVTKNLRKFVVLHSRILLC